MRRTFDIDIDVEPTVDKSKYGTRASLYNEEQLVLVPHPSGYFLPSKDRIKEDVPVDPETGLSALEAKEGEDLGFFKVDLLNNTSYQEFESKEQLLKSLEGEDEFDWSVFEDKNVVEQLPHIHKHFSIVRQVAPKSIEEIADVLALIRPGKTELLDLYLKDKEKARKRLYKRPLNGGMYFKKSHALAYAHMIFAILNKPDKLHSFFY